MNRADRFQREMTTAAAGDKPLTEKELLKLHGQRLQRQYFMEYLLKQVAEVTYQYNCFEDSSLMAFATVGSSESLSYNLCRLRKFHSLC